MTDDPTSAPQAPQAKPSQTRPPQAKSPHAKRTRPSRYQRAQERRAAQKRADQRFYNGIFGIIGACVLVVLGLAMIASSGQTPTINGAGGELTRTTFIGLTGLEWAGLIVIAIVGVVMWRRIKKK